MKVVKSEIKEEPTYIITWELTSKEVDILQSHAHSTVNRTSSLDISKKFFAQVEEALKELREVIGEIK